MVSDIPPRFLARWELSRQLGTVVVIDVLRAFTTAAYAFAAGAEAIYLVQGVDEAISLAQELPDALVMGEEHGRRPPGFDFSNSPVEISRADLAGRVLVQRTSAGTQGAVAARAAERLFVASLVCASATAAAVLRCDLGPPTYVISGRFPDEPDGGTDDLVTAQLIERARMGLPLARDETVHAVAESPEAERTLAVGAGHSHADDIVYATRVDHFNFAMEVDRLDGLLRVRPRSEDISMLPRH